MVGARLDEDRMTDWHAEEATFLPQVGGGAASAIAPPLLVLTTLVQSTYER